MLRRVLDRHIEGHAAAFDVDRDGEAETACQGHQLLDREPADLLVHQRRDVRLVEAEQFAGGLLRQPALADLCGEKAHEARLDHQFVRLGQFEFVKRALRHHWLLSACRSRSSASFSRAWTIPSKSGPETIYSTAVVDASILRAAATVI